MTDIKLLKVGETLPINEELAGIVPMAIPSEQAALAADIQANGLREPVVLYKGRCVDGRCRMLACKLTGTPIMARELDDTLTEEEVKVFVKSVNTRRNLTSTQKIMVAAKESSQPGSKSIPVLAKAWGVSERGISSAKYIAKHKAEYVQPLFNGSTVTVTVQRGFAEPVEVETDKVSVIAKSIKIELERAKLVVTMAEVPEWNPDSQITTEKGKQWYAEVIEDMTDNPVKYGIMLANLQFRLE